MHVLDPFLQIIAMYVCMYVYMYMYIYMHTLYVITYIHTYIHTYLHMHILYAYKWNYWRVKYLVVCSNNATYWWDFKLVDFSTIWKEIHACSINGLIILYEICQIAKLKSPPNKSRIQ